MGNIEELYRTHIQAVFRYALSCTGRHDLAEDLTSEAFLALHRNLEHVNEALLPGWLLTVVRNRARDLWRRRMVEQRYAQQLAAHPALVEPKLGQWILQSGDLKPVHKTCLALRYLYGMNRVEIADTTGLTETQVKSYLQYALELLRKNYKSECTRGKTSDSAA
jgi:RNA polymerase sigma-70 factor, ECF subfamily